MRQLRTHPATTFFMLSCSYHHLSGRRCIPYKISNTPSRGPLPKLPKNTPMLKLLKQYENQIAYLMTCRMILFALDTLYYYKRNINIIPIPPRQQHGSGSNGFAGCHASFIPNKLEFHHGRFLPKRKKMDAYNQKKKGEKLHNDQNMTVYLPSIANDTDRIIEGYHGNSLYRKAAFLLLNDVSRGMIKPEAALHIFKNIMQTAIKEAFFQVKNEKNRTRKNAFIFVLQVQKKALSKFNPNRSLQHFLGKKKKYGEAGYSKAQKRILSIPYQHKGSSIEEIEFSSYLSK